MNTAAKAAELVLGDRPTVARPEYKTRPGEKMKALRWHGAEDVRVEEVPIPSVTEPKDVVIKVTATTVCGSDLHLYHKEIMDLKDGDILGHEFMGIVDEVGPEVKNFKPGDRVVASFQIACGECDFCKKGLTSMCDATNKSTLQGKFYGSNLAGIFGYSHFAGGFAGGQAEFVRVPFADNNLLKVPDDVPDEKALYLSDIIPTSYHAVKCANVEKGNTVGIWGLGPIGMLAARWCQIMGASKIIGIDNVKERLEFAKNKLKIDVINFDEEKDVVEAIHKRVPNGLDCAIDAAAFRYAKGVMHKIQRAVGTETDTSETVNECLRATRKFGSISLIADYVGICNGFMIGALMEKGIMLRGAGQCPVQKYWHDLLRMIREGVFDPTIILTHRVPLDEFDELYKEFDKKKDILKVFVQTKFSNPPAPGTPQVTHFKDVKAH